MKARRKMKANLKMFGIIAGAAAALVFPTIRLVKFLQARISERRGRAQGEGGPLKAFSPAYRGKHKPHHRHANDHAGPAMG
jgi:hypothetical protein